MAASRPMGSAQGPLCPGCGHPHFPFCARHQSLHPTPPLPLSLQGHLPRPPVQFSLPPSQAAAFMPLAHHPPSFPDQPVMNWGSTKSNLESHIPPAKVLLSRQLQQNGRPGEGAGLQDSGARHHGVPQAFHAQGPDSFHIFLPLSGMGSVTQSSEFPRTLSPPNSPSGLTRSPASGWIQEDARDSDKVPAMPQWFIDQKRRSTITGAAVNTRSGFGEFGRPVSTFSSPPLQSELPVQRMVNSARIEIDRQMGFADGGMLGMQTFERRLQESVQGIRTDRNLLPLQGLHFRSDIAGHGGAQGVGRQEFGGNGTAQMKTGFNTTVFEQFVSQRGGIGDGDSRPWGASSENTNGSFGEQGNAFLSSGHPRNANVVNTAPCREEQLLREHGLLDDSSEGMFNSRQQRFTDGPAEHQDDFGFVQRRPQISNDVRPGLGDKLYSVDKTMAADRMHCEGPVHDKISSDGEQNLSFANQTSPYDEPGLSQQNGQKQHMPPQDELDELYYLKHFRQHDERQDTSLQPVNQGNQFQDGRALRSFVPSSQLAVMRGSLQETSVSSQPWLGDERNTASQHPGRLQHPDRVNHQLPPPPHFQSQERTADQNLESQHAHLQQSMQVQPKPLPPPQISTVRQTPLGAPVHFQKPSHVYQQSHVLQQSTAPVRSQLPHQFPGNIHPKDIQQPGQPTHVQSQQHLGASQRQPQHPFVGSINTDALLQNQSAAIHQVQKICQSHVARFHLNAQGNVHHQYSNTSIPQPGSLPDGESEKPHVSVGPGRVPYLPQVESMGSSYLPPLPPPASAPPPPPPLPHSPPPHSPPAAPLVPPPLGSLSPPKEQVAFNAAGTASAVPSGSSTKQSDLEDRHLGFHFRPPYSGLHQPMQSVSSPGSGFQSLGTPYMQPVYGQQYGVQQFPPKLSQATEQPKVVNAASIFRKPARLSRPDRFVVILRGLPGSGKSYLAKALRDVELLNGGTAPRIHSIDDYFMTEVEKVEGEDSSMNSASNMRGKNRVLKKVMEYCYEPEMEEIYRASMLKAFKKTLEEGMFSFVIVDDRNVLVADFAQFWAIAKRSGYEVYLLEAPYKDPAGCLARNVHNFTLEQIQGMAERWEVTPPLYLQLDISSLFRGDELNAQDITEVEMDADDMEREADEHDESFKLSGDSKPPAASIGEETPMKGDRWETIGKEAEEDQPKPVKRRKVKEEIESDSESSSDGEGVQNNALSGLMMAYAKKDKRVQWADQKRSNIGSKGFSIGSVAEKEGTLLIGPGPGYNRASNPVVEDEKTHVGNDVKHTTKFLDQYRAEQETFKAVFARRRHRVEGFDDDEIVARNL
ncbi:hypothetical protein R1flu_023620 [Riccia fluitans]|uniref:YLP motif-containing protein 1 n=1 Tax=Riccia fluitans TaxID=41844 RepID=A0ABD1XTC9_9MARC